MLFKNTLILSITVRNVRQCYKNITQILSVSTVGRLKEMSGINLMLEIRKRQTVKRNIQCFVTAQ